MNALRIWWRQQQFEPTAMGLLANPFYFARCGLRKELGALFPDLRGAVLDVGCGRKPYRDFIPATRYVGVDIETPATRALAAADAYYDGRTLPFPDASFDGLLCTQVLEHVFEPEAFVRELARVLRSGGVLVLAVPFAWDEHEQPVDFARYSSFGLRALLERNGFTVVAQRKSMADLRALVQLGSAWLYKVTRSRSRIWNLLAQLLLIAPWNIAGGIVGRVLPGNPDFYLDNVVQAKKRGL